MSKINLFRMRKLNRDTMKIQWRIEQEKARAEKSTTVITGMPRGGVEKDKVADGAVQIADLKETYREALEELQSMREMLDPLIDSLENVDDRAVMRLRYVKGYSPEDIAEAIHRTARSIYYYLDRAEDKIVKLYPDKVQSNG